MVSFLLHVSRDGSYILTECEFYHLMRLDKQTCDWHNKKCDSLYVTQDISKGACQAAVNAVALIRVKINPVATNNVASRIFRFMPTFGETRQFADFLAFLGRQRGRAAYAVPGENLFSPPRLGCHPPGITKSGHEPKNATGDIICCDWVDFYTN